MGHRPSGRPLVVPALPYLSANHEGDTVDGVALPVAMVTALEGRGAG